MSRYRKRSVEVDAWRWLFNDEQEGAPAWVESALVRWPSIGGINFEPAHEDGPRICIRTLDAVAVARPGDWIIRGTAGEHYPCRADIFERIYEAVSPDAAP